MKSIIFIRANKEILKPEFQKNHKDTVTLYRTDSVGSKSSKREYAKVYGQEKRNNEVIVNGCDKEQFKSLFVSGQVSWLKDMFKDPEYNKHYHSYVGKTIVGYESFENKDVDGFSINGEATHVSSVDMFIITCYSDGTVIITDAIVENRNKNIELILK